MISISYGTVQALAFGIPSAFILAVAARALYRWLAGKRWDAHARSAVQIVGPGHPEDTELEEWERDELERIALLYADDEHPQHPAPGWQP